LLLYYITDRAQFRGDERVRVRALLHKITEAARCGVDFIQLREKDLSTRDLEALARAAVECVRQNSDGHTRLLINSRTDIAIAAGADGVHLRSDDISPSQVVAIWKRAHPNKTLPVIGVSCHTSEDVVCAVAEKASFTVFAPVFEKAGSVRPDGLAGLRDACAQKIPVLALGGVTLENAKACVGAGAAGVAAIRLFQENEVASVVKALRS